MSGSSWAPSPGDWVVVEPHKAHATSNVGRCHRRVMRVVKHVGTGRWPVGIDADGFRVWIADYECRLATQSEIAAAQLDQESGL